MSTMLDGIRCAFIGHLGADAIVRYTQEDTPLARVSVAVHDSRANGGVTECVNVAHFGDQADELAPLLTKGSLVYVEVRVRLEQCTGADGERSSRST